MSEKDSNLNPVLQSVYLSLLEILGEGQAANLFNEQEIDPGMLGSTEVSGEVAMVVDRIGDSLNQEFGQMAAQGLLIRAGRASLVFFRRFFNKVADLGSLENRLKPVDKRFFHSLRSLADLWSHETGLSSNVEQVDHREFKWLMSAPARNDGGNQTFLSYFLFGLLEEFCAWLDARKSYRIVYSQPENGDLAELSIAIQPQN